MFVATRMDPTSIRDIEVSTFFSGSLHELSRRLVEYIIYPTTESITPLTHRVSTRHRRES